jgi:hypothetical protein
MAAAANLTVMANLLAFVLGDDCRLFHPSVLCFDQHKHNSGFHSHVETFFYEGGTTPGEHDFIISPKPTLLPYYLMLIQLLRFKQ